MAVGLDQDTESLQRTSIPSGTSGTLTGGGFSDFFAGVWLYRPSATATYALTAGGGIFHGQAGAREIALGFNSAGSNLADLNLQVTFNSGGGTGAVQTFAGHAGDDFLDEWVYYFFYENSSNDQVAGYILLSDLNTANTITRANDNAGSQYINTLTFGNVSGNNTVVLGHYAYARAVNSASLTASNVLTYAASSSTESGDWGFWPLADNTDTGDDSGNSRTLTFGGTLTSETSPTLGGGGTEVGLAIETDTALALSRLQILATGLAVESDTALSLAAVSAQSAGVSTEADTALALTPLQIGATGVAVETDIALPLGVALATGIATEIDIALALDAFTGTQVGLASETDTALALSAVQIAGVGLASETDTALQLSAVSVGAVGLSSETDTALALSAVQSAATSVAIETDTALNLLPGGAVAVGMAVETDTAFALAGEQIGGIVIPQTSFSEFSGAVVKTKEAPRRPRIRAPKQSERRAERKSEPKLAPLVGDVGMAVEHSEALGLVGFVVQAGLMRTAPRQAVQRGSNEDRIAYLEREVSTLRRALASTRADRRSHE